MRLPRLLLAATTASLLVIALLFTSAALADTPAQRATALTFDGSSPTSVKGEVALGAVVRKQSVNVSEEWK